MIKLTKYNDAEVANEADVEKVIQAATTKATEKAAEEIASLRKQLGEAKVAASEARTAAAGALELQADNERLTKQIKDREEKDLATQMKKVLDGGIKAGKFRAEERPKWEKRFKTLGATDCEDLLKSMPAEVPMNERLGAGGDADETIGSQVEKVIQEIMVKDKCSKDVAIAKAYTTHSKLMKARDNAQLALSRRQGAVYGDDD